MGGVAALALTLGLVAGACGSVGGDEAGTESGGGDGGGQFAKDVGGQIVGIEAGAGLMKASQKAVEDYDLAGDYELKASSTPAMLAELEKAYKAKKPIVVTLWKPHWAYAEMDLKDLKDPKGAMGEAEKLWSVGRTGFQKDYPGLAAKLKEFKVDDATLSDLEKVALRESDDEAAGVKKWLADNPDFKEKIVPDDTSKDKKDLKIGWIPWDEDIVLTNAFEQVLNEAGYKVTKQQLEPGPLFTGLAQGQLDLFLDGWLPTTHKDYFDKYGDKLEKIGQWYDSASLAITVPKYVKDVNTIEDLKTK